MPAPTEGFNCEKAKKEPVEGEIHIVEISGFNLARHKIQIGTFRFETAFGACSKVGEINKILKKTRDIMIRVVWSIEKNGEEIKTILDW